MPSKVDDRGVRQRLLDAATELFYQHGLRGVGIDAIVRRAGVARMSLYNHFASKDELIVEVLRREDEHWRGWYPSEVERRAPPGRERLLAAFDVLEDWHGAPRWRGCPFNNALVELAPADRAALALIKANKDHDRAFYKRLAREAGLDQHEEIGDSAFLLAEGATAAALMDRTQRPARAAKLALARLLDAAARAPRASNA